MKHNDFSGGGMPEGGAELDNSQRLMDEWDEMQRRNLSHREILLVCYGHLQAEGPNYLQRLIEHALPEIKGPKEGEE